MVRKIILPGRIQTDTAIAIFLLRVFGVKKNIDISNASIEINPNLEGIDKKDSEILLLDIGGGDLDHHGKEEKITCSSLTAKFLEIEDNPSIIKLLTIAERCDMYGKGIMSEDLVDKAFGLPGLLVSLNRKYDNNSDIVFEKIFPILEAHYEDEKHRAEELPKILESKKETGDYDSFEIFHRGRNIKVGVLTSDDSVMPGFLRSSAGGAHDVVAQWMTTGHINIITKQVKRIDLRSLAALIRRSEGILSGVKIDDMELLSSSGRIKEILNWYYDTATNSLQNGGINPKSVLPTKISRESMNELLKFGLSEELWVPPKILK